MPLLKITQPILYKASKFEKTIENTLLKYGIILSDSEISYSAEDLKTEGFFRSVEDKIDNKVIELRYQKYLGREDFIEPLKKSYFGKPKKVNEEKLAEILNKNLIYSESLLLSCNYGNVTAEIILKEERPFYTKHKRSTIDFEQCPQLFGEMLTCYVKTLNIENINPSQIKARLTQILGATLLPYSLDDANKLIGTTLSENDYIRMLVLFFTLHTKKQN